MATRNRPRKWKARRGEDKLLERYWKAKARSGALWTEVGLAGDRKYSLFREGSSERRIDGVWVPKAPESGILVKRGSSRRIRELRKKSKAELIEVKQGLSEAVLGQCVAARELFAKQYEMPISRTVALVKVADPAMGWVAKQLGVKVEVIPNPARPGNGSTSRTTYFFGQEQIQRIDAWRRKNKGLFITKIPLGGPGSGVRGWNKGREVRAHLVRIPQGPNLLSLFDTELRFKRLVGRKAIDVIEARRRLTRGSIGRLLAHALLLERQYGLKVRRRLLLVEESDSALAWVCQQEDIEVVEV